MRRREICPCLDPTCGGRLRQFEAAPCQYVRHAQELQTRVTFASDFQGSGLLHLALDGVDGDVASDPVAFQPMRGLQGSGATTERVEHDVTLIRARLDDALQQRQGLLRGIAEAFFRYIDNGFYIVPYILNICKIAPLFINLFAEEWLMVKDLFLNKVMLIQTGLCIKQWHIVLARPMPFARSAGAIRPHDSFLKFLCPNTPCNITLI
ncbi:MAG: hypothetical protein M2R46_03674 [Verrucomicrobia subdivision 3 bacterium]|nr:hypothetical protein [Limisphaerales bacterium]